MSKLKRLQSSELDRLAGYLAAAQYVCIRGQHNLTLDAALFEILGRDITDEDVISAAYPDGFSPIEHRAECSLENMTSGVEDNLSLAREYWMQEYSIADIIESNVRAGYWQHVKACFDYANARIIELGHDVPYVNIGGGFTYLLYAADMSRCLLLVGNFSD